MTDKPTHKQCRQIVERLHDYAKRGPPVIGEAADEIERLLKLVDTLYREKNSEREMYTNAIDRYLAETERLRGRIAELELTGDRRALQAMLDQLGLDFERMRERAISAEDEITKMRTT